MAKFSCKAWFSSVVNKARIIVEETQKVVEMTNQQSTSFDESLPAYSITLFIDAERAFRSSEIGTISQEAQVIVGSLQSKTLPSLGATDVQVVVGSGKTFKPPVITTDVSVTIS
jgi:hypothetical protein